MHAHPEDAVEGRGKWMALAAALLGWMFDGFEMGLFPLAGPNALNELLASEIARDPTVKDAWFGVVISVFLIGAATGGVLFGWLGDRLGRVRAMALSILTYAVFTGLCGLATEAWHIAVLRFIASLGMGGEWALGVALVTELWPDRSRAMLAGLIGASANVGFLLVGLLSLVLVNFIQGMGRLLARSGLPDRTVEALLEGDGWRLLMIAGAVPALLVFFVRLFVPESHKWEAERAKGATSHWATKDLLGVLIGALGATCVVVLWSPVFAQVVGAAEEYGDAARYLFTALRLLATLVGITVALLGYMYPVKKYLARAEAARSLEQGERGRYVRRLLLGASLAGVALLGTWGSVQWAPKWAIALSNDMSAEVAPQFAKEYTQIALAAGAIVGTIAAALAGGWIGRRITYALLCVGSFVSLVYMYLANDEYGAKFLVSVFVAGGITAAFYGWFPLYLPELFPTSIRATSQGFAYNFGRVISAIGSLPIALLTAYFAVGMASERVEVDAAPKASATLAGIYLIGAVIIWFGPETKGKELPQ